jgi:hypothetical protein
MSENLHGFEADGRQTLVSLPFSLGEVIHSWNSFRGVMVKHMPDDFTRAEWAYLIQFISESSLRAPFLEYFGVEKSNGVPTGKTRLLKRRGTVGIWLPNNVSLLGPLMLILLSLSGCPMRIKVGSRSQNLAAVFLNYALERLEPGALRSHLEKNVVIDSFGHEDPRNLEMAGTAQVRILFGSDEAARQIEKLGHPTGSVGFYFTDKVSEGWVEPALVDGELVEKITKVFAIYGQAGCTSPRKIVLIGGGREQAEDLARRIAKGWSAVIKQPPARHTASNNVMARQMALAYGWKVEAVEHNGAVIAWGEPKLEMPSSPMFLPVTWASLDDALGRLPENIQTIGCALAPDTQNKLMNQLAGPSSKPVKRVVPLGNMHHFHYVWDGYAFWRELFTEIEMGIEK